MKKTRNRKTKIIIASIIIAVVAIIALSATLYARSKQASSPTALNSETTDSTEQQEPTNTADGQTQQAPSSSNTTPATTTATPPAKPTFTKSSGNNGPVPSGAAINFTCAAELNVDCSIILVASGKQTVVGPTKVTDNGRGQYFANFYWTSIKGSYQVTAQAKNAQGGVSTSNAQALEVQ